MDKEQAIEIIERHSEYIVSGSLLEQALSMAIDALKTQLSQEGTTSDLISRMETVEHLRRVLDATVPITDYDEGYVDGVEFGVSTVSTMPTIQPQSTAGQLNDSAQSTNLIDRQAAIDALQKCRKHCIDPFDSYHIDIQDAENQLSKLPTIQPEPHKGHWENDKHDMPRCSQCGYIPEYNRFIDDYYYSDYCPNCGARMKGATT